MAKWWLISWTTYATWLPGDERGYRTWRGKIYVPLLMRYATPGESIHDPSAHAAVHEVAQATSDQAVYLTVEEMKIARTAIVEEVAEIPVVPAIMSLGSWHVHWLCHFGTLKIRPTVGRVKAAATRELTAAGFQGKRPWTKGCNIRSKSTRHECRAAYKYVRNHREEGCLIYEWKIDPQYLLFD